MFEGLLIQLGIVAATTGYIFQHWYRSSRQNIHRKLAKLPHSQISEIKEDQLVRIVGTVKPHEHTVVAPVSGTTCVYFQIVVETKQDSWRPIVDVTHGIPFILEDASGFVYVDAARANLTTHHLRFYPAIYPDPMLDRFLVAHGVSPAYKHAIRIREMRIDVGATFTVMGAGVSDIDPLAAHPEGYRVDRATRLSFVGGRNHPLVISDDPSLR